MRLGKMRSVAKALSAVLAMDTWKPAFRRTASRTLSCTGLSSTRRTWFKNPSPETLPGDLAHQKPKNDCRPPQGAKRYAADRKPLPWLATSPARASRPHLRAASTAHRRVCGSSPLQPARLETRERIRASSSPAALPGPQFCSDPLRPQGATRSRRGPDDARLAALLAGPRAGCLRPGEADRSAAVARRRLVVRPVAL